MIKLNASKTQELDERVQKLLADGPKTNMELREAMGLPLNDYYPPLDKALQKLRRNGILKVVKGSWVLASVELCHCCGGKGWVESATKRYP